MTIPKRTLIEGFARKGGKNDPPKTPRPNVNPPGQSSKKELYVTSEFLTDNIVYQFNKKDFEIMMRGVELLRSDASRHDDVAPLEHAIDRIGGMIRLIERREARG